jgi:AraC-like DNA-binding protein
MRRSKHRQRQKFERAADLYLLWCYRRRSPARGSEFAAVIGVTHEYLSRTARFLVGLSLHEFLVRRRLARAAYLLRATPLRVQDIAVHSAFGTVATFYRCFGAAYCETPTAYREEVKKCDLGTPSRQPFGPFHPERTLAFMWQSLRTAAI